MGYNAIKDWSIILIRLTTCCNYFIIGRNFFSLPTIVIKILLTITNIQKPTAMFAAFSVGFPRKRLISDLMPRQSLAVGAIRNFL